MSDNCDLLPEFPVPCSGISCNMCNVNVGQATPQPMPHYCGITPPNSAEGVRAIYCAKMSAGNEWTPFTIGFQPPPDCFFDDCNDGQEWPDGCCKGCCSVPGCGGLICIRTKFTGDPSSCCFKDLVCNDDGDELNPHCYSDPTLQNTCANGQNGQPNYRTIVGSDCRDVLEQYCTGTLPGDDPTSTAWLSRWNGDSTVVGSCPYALARNMFAEGGANHCFVPSPPIPGFCNIPQAQPYDLTGYYWAQTVVSKALTRYAQQGFVIGALPGSAGWNPFQDSMYTNVCCPYPGLCQSGLENACAQYSAQRISLDTAVAQWCGCHLNSGEYQNYSVKYNIPPECTPMCNRIDTIPIIGVNEQPVLCKQNICLIDDVTVNIVNSQIGGGINFNQICANCDGAICSCIVDNTTVDIGNSTIGGNVVPIGEGCGSVSCTQTNPGNTGPNVIPAPCGTTGFNPYEQYEQEVAAAKAKARKTSVFWTLIIIGSLLLLIFVLIIFLQPNIYPTEGAVIPPPATTQTITRNSLPAINANIPINYEKLPNYQFNNNQLTDNSKTNFIALPAKYKSIE